METNDEAERRKLFCSRSLLFSSLLVIPCPRYHAIALAPRYDALHDVHSWCNIHNIEVSMMLLSSTLFPFLIALVGTKKTVNALILRERHLLASGKARIKSLVKWTLFSSSTGTFIAENNDLVEELEEFNPLRPPSYLASLRVGESYKIPIMDEKCRDLSITRLSRNPDIFLVPNFIVQTECLIDAAKKQGLKVAGTRKSQSNTIRTHSYITWLDDKNDNEDGAFNDHPYGRYRGFVRSITDLCNALFVHESLQMRHDFHSKEDHHQHQQQHQSLYVTAEDMQIAKYDANGCFHLHHDGFNRFLTVLTYLNGVGGTFFPLAQTKQSDNNHHEILSPPKLSMNDDGSLSLKGYVVGKDGLLIVGKEGETAYLDDENGIVLKDTSAIARIQAGDAVVFYSYNLLMKDSTNVISGHDPEQRGDAGHNKEWRAVHSALPAPQEKWIATSWFRSEVLTGPFAHLYRESLLSDSTDHHE